MCGLQYRWQAYGRAFAKFSWFYDAAQMGLPLTPVSSHDNAKVVAVNLLEGNYPSRDYTGVPFALAIRHRLTAEDIKTTMSAYPTGASDIGYML
jgi:hypothetical protein